jgi:hypothetical protein
MLCESVFGITAWLGPKYGHQVNTERRNPTELREELGVQGQRESYLG